MLEIKNLHVSIGARKILDGLTLTVHDGEVAAIMGPNGTGKSTLSYVVAGREGYEVTDGEVLLNGENLLDLEPHERAGKGVFLAFQYPVEIPGVATMTFLKAALNAQRRARGEAELQNSRNHEAGQRRRGEARRRQGNAAPRAQQRLFGRREEAHGNLADGAAGTAPRHSGRDRLLVSTSTRCEWFRRASIRCGPRIAAFSSSPIISACLIISNPIRCM